MNIRKRFLSLKRISAGPATGLAVLVFASGIVAVAAASTLSAGTALYWPAPPPDAKVAYVRQFRSEKDFKHSQRSLWNRLKLLLVGAQEEWAIKSPYGLDVNKDRLYVADSQARTVWVADFGRDTFAPFVRSTDKEPLPSPVCVAVEEDGRVFVSDTGRQAVLVYSGKGKYLGIIGQGDFGRPTGLAIDHERHLLYVVDTARNRVEVYSTSNLKRVRSFGRGGSKPGEFNFPLHIAQRAGLVYVADAMNFRVQVFDERGEFLGEFGQMGDGPGDFARPKGIAVDSFGNAYVADALFDNVQIFDRLGRVLMSFGSLGEAAGRFWLPAGMAIDERNRIYVADSANRRVQVFQLLGRGGD